jgi:hypothetical protein
MRGWGWDWAGGLRRPAKRLYLDNDLEKPANRPGLNRESTQEELRDEERRGIRRGGGGGGEGEEGRVNRKGKERRARGKEGNTGRRYYYVLRRLR